MSDETDKPNAEADKPSAGADKPSAEADKPSAEADKSSAQADKPSAEADKSSAQADKPGSGAGKPGAKPGQRSKKEKILIAAVALAVIGFIYAVFHLFEVLKDAQNPYSQSTHPVMPAKPVSEAELEKDEQQFQPKSVVPIPKDSAVMHERPNVPVKKVEAKSGKPHKAK